MRFRARVATGVGMLGPNLEMSLCLGVNPLGFAVGVLLAVLLVCWRVTTPVPARELPMAVQPW